MLTMIESYNVLLEKAVESLEGATSERGVYGNDYAGRSPRIMREQQPLVLDDQNAAGS
jgi:hypothetical protein